MSAPSYLRVSLRTALVLAAPLTLLYACTVPDHTFDDAKYYGQSTPGAGGDGTAGSSEAGGTSAGGTKAGGSGGVSGHAGNAGVSGGNGGSAGATGGTSSGNGGSAGTNAGNGGTKGGSSGSAQEGGSSGASGQGQGGTNGGSSSGAMGGTTAGTTSQGGAGTGGADTCEHGVCQVGGDALVDGCNSCVSMVCAQNSECCDTGGVNIWAQACADAASSLCGSNCGSGGMGGGAGAGGSTAGTSSGGSGGCVGTGAKNSPCTTSCDCAAGLACNNPNSASGTWFCGAANGSGADLGAACSSSTQCKSGYCDPYSGQCTLACQTDADCNSATACVGQLTQSADINQFECMAKCTTDSACSGFTSEVGSEICPALMTPDHSNLIPVCDGPAGGMPFGSTVDCNAPACAGGLPISTGNCPATTYCTKVCGSPSDCAAPLPNCMLAVYNFQYMDMGTTKMGQASLHVCTP